MQDGIQKQAHSTGGANHFALMIFICAALLLTLAIFQTAARADRGIEADVSHSAQMLAAGQNGNFVNFG